MSARDEPGNRPHDGDPVTPPQDAGGPDEVESDPVALSSSEDLDEDQLGLDPLEEGVEPPEQWAGADQYGTTPYEQHRGEDLDLRLRREQADDTGTGTGDGSGTDLAGDPEGAGPSTSEIGRAAQEPAAEDPRTQAERHGQSADEAGGSVAEALRDPEETDLPPGESEEEPPE